jgi:hypothetical protein
MDFLSPGLAWFAMAGAIPIIIHLLNRQRYKRMRWAAMDFLLAALRKTRRRLQLENLLLMLIRVLLLVLLALALARPYLTKDILPVGHKNVHLVLCVDTSYSMGYKQAQKTPLARAKELAATLIRSLKNTEGDLVTIVPFHEQPGIGYGPAGALRSDRALAFLEEEVQLTGFGTRLPRLVEHLREILDKPEWSRPERRVIILTDLQRTAWKVDESARERFEQALADLSRKAEVYFVPCGAPEPANRTVAYLGARSRVVLARRPVTFEVRVRNQGPHPVPALGVTLKIDRANPQTERLPIETRSSQDFLFTYEFPEPGPHLVSAEADPDFLASDDARHLAIQVLDTIHVLIVDGEPGPGGRSLEGESVFLRLALNPQASDAVRPGYFTVTVETPATFDEKKLGKYAIAVLANVDTLSEDRVRALESFVRAGGGLLITAGNLMDRLTYNDLLFKEGKGLLPARLREVAGDKGHASESARRLVEIDFRHPALEFFRDRLQAALGSLVIFEYVKTEVSATDPAVRVLARYDDPEQSPALLERRYGRGKVVLLTTTCDAEWNLLPGRPPYLVLMHELCKYLAERAAGAVNVHVGEPFQLLLPMERYAKDFTLVSPRQEHIKLFPAIREDHFLLCHPSVIEEEGKEPKAGAPPIPLRELGLSEAGAYELFRPGGAGEKDQLVSFVAANVRPEEGDLEPVTEDELRRAYPGFKFQLKSNPGLSSESETGVVTPPHALIGRWFLWAILALLAAESLLAWRFGSRQ